MADRDIGRRAYAGWGTKDETFAQLHQILAYDPGAAPFYIRRPKFHDLRGDPRYEALMKRMDLKP